MLATKFGMDMGDGKGPRGSRDYIRQAVEASLRRLRTDVIDVYWYHQPDGQTPIAETLETLDELVRAGHGARHRRLQLRRARRSRRPTRPPASAASRRSRAVQNEYSLLAREAEDDALPACERLGLGFVPFFPLASGLLTGKYRPGEAGPAGARLSDRDQIATDGAVRRSSPPCRTTPTRTALSLLDVAIGALLADQTVSSVIAGATRPEQVRANAAAARWHPSTEDLAELREVLAAHPL